MSKKLPPTHKEYCDAIIRAVGRLNTDAKYAQGFLASYLASLMLEDPWAYKRFQRHMDQINDRKN